MKNLTSSLIVAIATLIGASVAFADNNMPKDAGKADAATSEMKGDMKGDMTADTKAEKKAKKKNVTKAKKAEAKEEKAKIDAAPTAEPAK